MDFLHVLAAASVTPDMSGGCGKGDMMKDALDIDWAEATAYEMTGALRFSGVLADDDYQSEQTARLEIAATLRRRCVPIERVAELEGQGWRPVTEEPVEMDNYIVYCKDGYLDGAEWDGTEWIVLGDMWEGMVTHWRPWPAPPQ